MLCLWLVHEQLPALSNRSAPPATMVGMTEPDDPNSTDRSGWVQVPQHPYAATPGESGGGKVFAILAMALGLAAVFTVVVAAFYASGLAWVGVIFGSAAAVLGGVALAKKQHPRLGSVVGLTGGTASVIGGLAVTGVVFAALFAPVDSPTTARSDASGTEWTPDTEAESLIEWPANMATGGVVFLGPNAPTPLTSSAPAPATPPTPHAINRTLSNDVLIYVDYRCPVCSDFEQANGAFLETAIASGTTTVEIVPLSFLDRASPDSYSSRAAGAIACVVNAQPEAAWSSHQALLSPDVQPASGSGLTNKQLLSVLEQASGGLNAQVKDCIETEQFVTFAQALNGWAFANPVPNATNQEARLQGTPSVFVNGQYYAGSPSDSSAFESFFNEQATVK